MTSGFLILGMLTLGGAAAAMVLRNLVRSLLCLVVSFLGLAGLYLSLSATFVALTQVLVYVGAVAILLVFAILLTRGGRPDRPRLAGTASWVAGFAVALLVFGGLLGAVAWGSGAGAGVPDDPTVRRIGESLMTQYVLPLECIALLLTGAMLGAVGPGDGRAFAGRHNGAATGGRAKGGRIVTPLQGYLVLSACLFSVGLAGALTRRNAILVLMGIELMLNAANLNFVAFWRFGPDPVVLDGILFAVFAIAVAAAEAAVGLALVIAVYRHYRTAQVDEVDELKD